MKRYRVKVVVFAVALFAIWGLCQLLIYAQGYNQACFIAPVGGGNRAIPCTSPGSGCNWSDACQGTCYGQYAALSCDNYVESQYEYCRGYPYTECVIVGSLPCLTYRAYYTSMQCVGAWCQLTIYKDDCQTNF